MVKRDFLERRLLPTLPGPVPGFEHLRRFWDPLLDRTVVKITPGEYYVGHEDELVSTVVGSCIAACLHDPAAGIGGINHFLLPEHAGDRSGNAHPSRADRFGVNAMRQLIDAMLQAGARREHLRLKLFGGGIIMHRMSVIAQHNIAFMRQFVRSQSLHLVAADFGGRHPRQLQFFPHSGRVRARKLQRSSDAALVTQEQVYLQHLLSTRFGGARLHANSDLVPLTLVPNTDGHGVARPGSAHS